jgi:hypothetical protein
MDMENLLFYIIQDSILTFKLYQFIIMIFFMIIFMIKLYIKIKKVLIFPSLQTFLIDLNFYK